MQRRAVLTTAAVAVLSRRTARAKPESSLLRYVPQSDLTVLDPVMTTAYITRFHAMMVWDQLYGIDSNLRPQPQMVDGHTVEDGGRLWTFTLRDGLRFSDGTPVRGRDCVASIKRWAARDPMGQALLARVVEMGAPIDRRFTIRLQRPFSLVLDCLAKVGPPALVVMPERLANTDPYIAITEMIGSGPFLFAAKERVVGSKVVYTRNPGYVPRPSGTPDWFAGPKIVNFDRVEWDVMPDPATAAAALQNAEVDWWENPPNDLLPVLDRAEGVRTETAGRLGFLGTAVFNHLYPPFDKPAVRRVMLQAISQADFMTAAAGTDSKMWRADVGIFTPDTPMANAAGLDVITAKKPPLSELARMLREAGYKEEKVVLLSPSDQEVLSAECDVALDLMKKLEMNVDFQAMDWGTLVQRRAKKDPPNAGGWNMFITGWNGLDMTTPITNQTLRSNGSEAWFGWPDIPQVQSGIDAWLDAPDLATQQKLAVDIQAKALEFVPYLPTGQYFARTACRQDITGIMPGQYVFWNVRRT